MTICRNALFFADAAVTKELNLKNLSLKEAELLAYSLETYSTKRDLEDIMLYKQIGKSMKESLRVNILDAIKLIEQIINLVESNKVRATLEASIKKAKKFEKDNEKTINMIRGMQDNEKKASTKKHTSRRQTQKKK